MIAKFVTFLALAAIAAAADFTSFSYGVADPYTGDFKHQIENRLGDNVNGQYSLLESDGTRRTVDYAAGAGGFNAVVRKDPALVAPVAHVAAPAVYSAPYGIARLGAVGYSAISPYSILPYGRYY